MPDYSFWSVVPPLLAIILAIVTRRVFLSLGLGILAGGVIIAGGAPLPGIIKAGEIVLGIFGTGGNTETIIFTLLMGIIIAFIQRSGGVAGFNHVISRRLETGGGSPARLQLWAALTGLAIFVESNISALTVGALYRPVTDRMGISREKLAYIADSTSAPSSILIPLNAWGGFIMGLLLVQGFDHPFGVMIRTVPLNFYPIFTVLLLLIIIRSGRDFGPMAKAEIRARTEGKALRDGASPVVSADVTMMEPIPGTRTRASSMVLPLAVMVTTLPLMLVITGWGNLPDHNGSITLLVARAVGYASGAKSVLYAVAISITITVAFYTIKRILPPAEMMRTAALGMEGMVPMALLMVLAFATGEMCNLLGTGRWIAEVTAQWLTPGIVPFIIFLTGCFMAFSTGTSWGTFAIMIAIAVPVAQALDAGVSLTIAAALGGGVFGDHCSPISDTTLISSMASASDHIDHVRTQLPYALTAGLAAAATYLVLGLIT